ncbi:MAG: DNA cytosine methyltransferase, partial [Planctomycetes bacterium]|nr:DNA cytosine methyltransferase [Planctomycetota bacterium]
EDYGVPQRRARIFLISIRDDLDGEPTPPPMTHLYTPRSIEWAIHDLETVVDESVPNQSQFFLASTAKRGNGQGDEISRAQLPAYTVRANAKSRVQFLLPLTLVVANLLTFGVA